MPVRLARIKAGQARRVAASLVMAGKVRWGKACSGKACRGKVRLGRQGTLACGTPRKDWWGVVRFGRLGLFC